MQTTAAEARKYVINVVANDYESFPTVRSETIGWAAQENKDLSEAAVKEALIALVRDGLVECFEYRSDESKYRKASFDPHHIDQYWYFVSKLGARSLNDEPK